MKPKIVDALKFTINEAKKANLEGYCRDCHKIYCDGWTRILVEVDGHKVESWKCEVYTIL